MSFNVELLLFVALIVSGVIVLIDCVFFRKARHQEVQAQDGFADLSKKKQKEALQAPMLADWAYAFLPVLVIVILFRSFFYEPFRVPTGSMLPTIQLNDFLLVNKYAYGIHLPLSNKKITKGSAPKRGDIAVFPSPPNPNVSYVKTVVAVAGDKVSYINKHLYVNGKPLKRSLVDQAYIDVSPVEGAYTVDHYKEHIGTSVHDVYNTKNSASVSFYNIVVPKGKVFAMGDNRDHSGDSRYFGFVDSDTITGRADYIWFSWDSQHSKVRWDRLFTALPRSEKG